MDGRIDLVLKDLRTALSAMRDEASSLERAVRGVEQSLERARDPEQGRLEAQRQAAEVVRRWVGIDFALVDDLVSELQAVLAEARAEPSARHLRLVPLEPDGEPARARG